MCPPASPSPFLQVELPFPLPCPFLSTPFPLLLPQVKPPVGLATPRIFKSLDLARRSTADPLLLLRGLSDGGTMTQALAVNDLEQPAFDKCVTGKGRGGERGRRGARERRRRSTSGKGCG